MVGKPMSKLLIPSAEQFDWYLVNKAWGHTSTDAGRMKYWKAAHEMSTVYPVYWVRLRSCRKITCNYYAINSSITIPRKKRTKEGCTGSHKTEVSWALHSWLAALNNLAFTCFVFCVIVCHVEWAWGIISNCCLWKKRQGNIFCHWPSEKSIPAKALCPGIANWSICGSSREREVEVEIKADKPRCRFSLVRSAQFMLCCYDNSVYH